MQFRILSLAVALGLPSLAAAQAGPAATDLDEVVVTGTRTAVTVDQSLAAVEVIDREQIARSQARSLPDLLRGRAGISLSNQGGPGKLTTLFLRGSESDHVLVLVDGVRIGSATSGLAALQDLPVTMVDRVEIVRGPRSSLYGSEAIGGVIQVFTRRDRDGFAPRLSATVGSHGLREGSAGFGGANGRGWFGVDASYTHDDGIDACDVATPTPFSGGCFIFAPEPDRDGYRNRALSLRGGVDAHDALSLEAHALRAEGRSAFDGDFVNLSKTVQQVFGAKATWRAGEQVTVQLNAGRNTDASGNFLHKFDGFSGTFVEADMGYFDTDRDSATLQGDVELGAGRLLTLGLDWLRDRVDSDTAFDRTARGNRAAFVQYQAAIGAHDLQASVRRDDNDQFGGHTTGSIAWGLDLGDAWRLTAGTGTAFKAPTFNELYFPFFGNAALRPEDSQTWELGLARRGADSHWRVDAFHTEVDDLIAFDAALFLPNNIERARMQGVELGLGTQLAQWHLDASASVIDTENRRGPHAGNDLPRRARHSARVALDRAFGAFRVGLTAVGEGARHDDVANTRRLGGHATLDLRAEYALTPAWTLQARAANVFDREYETASFYNQPGREWFVTVRYAPAD